VKTFTVEKMNPCSLPLFSFFFSHFLLFLCRLLLGY
jgi:hypothetical protein